MSNFDGHRIYNGCPDSTMQKRLDYERKSYEDLQKSFPGAHVTYFPGEGKWLGFYNYKQIGDFYDTKIDCIFGTLKTLKETY